jgi:hypothetical protein
MRRNKQCTWRDYTWSDPYGKVKQSHYRPWGFQKVEAPRFEDNWHMREARLSALRTGRLYPQEIFLVLINVWGWVDLRAIVRPEGLCQLIIPMTPSGIDPATIRFIAQCLNHCATAYHLTHMVPDINAIATKSAVCTCTIQISNKVRIHNNKKPSSC